MEGELNVVLFGDGKNCLQKDFVVPPHLIFGKYSAVGQGRVANHVQIEGGHVGTAPTKGGRRRPPDAVGHPVVAKNRDTGASDVANRFLIVLDLFVAFGQSQHCSIVELQRDVF